MSFLEANNTHLRCKPLVQLLGRVKHLSMLLRAFLDLCHERRVLVAFEQARYFAVRQQRIETLQETGIKNVRLVHNEADLLAAASRPTQHLHKTSKLVKVSQNQHVANPHRSQPLCIFHAL